jgi:hypothetical protein
MSADNPTPDVQQFQDDEGGPLRSWYAEGHHEPAVFAAALVHLLLDEYDDDIPSIELDRIRQRYMRKVPNLDGGWTSSFSDEPGRGAMAVTLFDAEVSRRGLSCAVRGCDRPVSTQHPVRTAVAVEGVSEFTVDLTLCRDHSRQMPNPSYRVFMVPVGATILLPSESERAS